MTKQTIKKKKKVTGLSIKSISFVSFIMFGIVLTSGLYLGQQDPLRTLASQRQDVADSVTKQTALKFTSQVESYSHILYGLAKDPALINILVENNSKARQLRQQELKAIFPRALLVRLLPATTNKPDKTQEPHFTYACLDLLNQSKKEGFATQVEMHEIEGKQQHIDMMQAVSLNGRVIGFIQLALDSRLLTSWAKKAADKSYLEIHQKIESGKNYLIAKTGNGIKQGVHAVIDIPGTHWQSETWTTFDTSDSAFNMGMVFALGMGLVLSGLATIILYSVLHKELQSDLDKYLMLITGALRGSKKHQIDFSLVEFKQAATLVGNLKIDHNNMERERDSSDEKNNESNQGDLPDTDPMFMSKDSIMLEEIDDTSEFEESGTAKVETAVVETPEVASVNVAASNDAGSNVGANNKPSIAEEIFKAYDIRGIVGQSLTVENIQLIGHALGSETKARGQDVIVFARDGRLSGPELGQSLVKGLMAAGLKVIDIGMLPTPTLYYAAAELTNGTGVMLTGSHNPPNYNGIKMVIAGETLSGESIQSLRQRIVTNNMSHGEGAYTNEKILEKYISRIISDIKLQRKMKIVIDCGNGVAGAVAPGLFKQLGCDVTELYCDVDGKFPNHHPDPSQPENLADLIKAVKKQNADLGLAFDGDGDRIGVISGDGKVIWPDRIMMLFAKDVLSRNPGATIIYDIKCSSNLRTVIEEEGGKPLMWKTGHSLIKEKMKETNALLAGEMSGHIFFKERWYGFDDALYSAARLLEIVAAQVRQPRVVFSSLPDSVNTPELKIDMQEGEHFKFIELLKEKASVFTDAQITLIDGIRVDYKDAWGLVRASNTTPCLVLRFEGQNKKAMAQVQDKFREVLTSIRSDIKLPF